MQQPHTHSDGQPQQPSIQYSNQQQVPPQMMLCPVQFVYDPQVLVPPDEHAQQPQQMQQTQPVQAQPVQHQTYIINVQNTPPWIQNRPNMVYMPQVVNNIPYLHQNMVQNPMINYQYQPMIIQQDIRQLPMQMQNQNLLNQSIMQQQSMLQKQQILQNQQNQTKLLQAQQMNQQRLMQPQGLVQNQMIPTAQIVQSPQRINAQTLVQNQQKLIQNQNMLQNQQDQLMQNQIVQTQVPTQIVRHRLQAPQNMQNQRMIMTQIPQSVANTQPRPKTMPVLAQMLQTKQQTGNQTDNQMITLITKPVNPTEMTTLRPQYSQMVERQIPQMIAINSLANHSSHNTTNTLSNNNASSSNAMLNQSLSNSQNSVSTNNPTSQPNNNQTDTTVPQHIRNQIPEGLSVKTVFKVPMTATVRPTAPDDPRTPKPVMRNSTTNTETNYKRKIRDMIEQKDDAQAKRAKTNAEAAQIRHHVPQVRHNMPQIRHDVPQVRHNVPQVRHEAPQMNRHEAVSQNDEKPLRNTVFIQARGRINETAESNRINAGISSIENEHRPIVDTVTANTSNLNIGTITTHIENNPNLVQENINTPNVNMHTSIDNAIENVVRLTSNPPISFCENVTATITNSSNNETDSNQMSEEDRTLNEIKITLESMKRAKLLSEVDTRMKEIENRTKESAIQNKKKPMEKEPIQINKTPNEKESAVQIPVQNNKKLNEIILGKSLTEKENTVQINKKATEKDSMLNKNLPEKENTVQNKNEFEKENTIQNKKDISSLEDFKRKQRKSDERKIDNKPKMAISMKDRVEKFVLTHVLDGHIIQESNEPFMVKKPTLPFQRKQIDIKSNKEDIKSAIENDVKPKTDTDKPIKMESSNIKPDKESDTKSKKEESSTSTKIKTEKSTKAKDNETGGPSKRGRFNDNKESKKESPKKEKEIIKTEQITSERDMESKRITEREDRLLTDNDKSVRREIETATKESSQMMEVKIELEEEKTEETQSGEENEDNPFDKINIDTLKSWSMSDLYDHLTKHNWLETAQKLQEEEIDGESLLLVSMEQLLQIGINENHATVLSAFIETEQE